MLQFGYALLPYVLVRTLLPGERARLGGHWLSLVMVHSGGVLLWASIFVKESQALLHGTAYAFWVISMIPMIVQLWQIFRAGLAQLEPPTPILGPGEHGVGD